MKTTKNKLNANTSPALGGKEAWWGLILVGLAHSVSLMDRQILAILIPRIKEDLNVGDTEMGLLYGTVFALFYAFFSLPLGRLADGWLRTRLLTICVAAWSLMTALGGMANSFALLAVSRLGVGIGESAVQPAGMSLVSDLFPKERRGTTTAIIASFIAFGLGIAVLAGGLIADTWDAYFPDGAPMNIKGWQAAFLIASVPGFVLAVLIARFREPTRGAADGIIQTADPHPFRASANIFTAILPGSNWISLARHSASARIWTINLLALIIIALAAIYLSYWTNGLRTINPTALSVFGLDFSGNTLQWIVTGFGAFVIINWLQSLQLSDRPAFKVIAGSPSLILLIVVASLQMIINYALMGWSPSFLVNEYGLSPTEVGMIYGPLMMVLGILGPLIGGPISDWAHKKIKGGRLNITLFSLTVSPPLAIWTFQAGSILEFYIRFSFLSIILTMWLPPIYASLMDLVLPRMRGMVMSLFILSTTIFGLGMGPYFVGLISDVNGGDVGSAIQAMFWVSPGLIVFIFLAILRYRKDEASIYSRAQAAGESL